MGVIASVVIDRFEGDWAVMEYGNEVFKVPKQMLPKECSEGDILEITVSVDKAKSAERRKRINSLTEDLFEQ